jgi:hypothetical protein
VRLSVQNCDRVKFRRARIGPLRCALDEVFSLWVPFYQEGRGDPHRLRLRRDSRIEAASSMAQARRQSNALTPACSSDASSRATRPENRITAAHRAPACTVHIRSIAPCLRRGSSPRSPRPDHATTAAPLVRASPSTSDKTLGQGCHAGTGFQWRILTTLATSVAHALGFVDTQIASRSNRGRARSIGRESTLLISMTRTPRSSAGASVIDGR